MKYAALALLLVAWSALACDAMVLAGYAYHGDRSHNYNDFTKGVGCEWRRGPYRYGGIVFENSNRNTSLLGGGSWIPLTIGAVGLGIGGGLATGYGALLQPAGGVVLEASTRDYAIDASFVPRVYGMKGSVLWVRLKLPLRD